MKIIFMLIDLQTIDLLSNIIIHSIKKANFTIITLLRHYITEKYL